MQVQLCFNPRARGGRDNQFFAHRKPQGCFNPRARGGRDKRLIEKGVIIDVSIHAPAGGATSRHS